METQSATDTAPDASAGADAAPVVPKTQEELKIILNALRKGENVVATNEDMEELAKNNTDVVKKLEEKQHEQGKKDGIFKIPTHYYYILHEGNMVELKCHQYKRFGLNNRLIEEDNQGECDVTNENLKNIIKIKIGMEKFDGKIIWEVKKGIFNRVSNFFTGKGGRKSRKQRKSRKSRKQRNERKSRRSRR